MKVAIQLYGQPRYVTDSYLLGWKKFVNEYDVDFFIHTWFDNTGKQNKIKHYMYDDKLVSDDITIKTIDTICTLFNPVSFRYDPPQNFEEIMNGYIDKTSRINQAIYGQHMSAYKANQLRLDSKKNYDVVLKSRMDAIIKNVSLKETQHNTVVVPYEFKNTTMNPIFDHWAFGDGQTITKYCEVINYIDYFLSNGATPQSEFLIHLHLIKQKINIHRVEAPFLLTRNYLESSNDNTFNHIDHFDIFKS